MTQQTGQMPIRLMILTALGAALLAVLSQIAIPLPGGVPINLALLAVYVVAALLPAPYGVVSVGIFLLLGAVGAPVFAQFRGGVDVLMGKTGGYLIGYVLSAAFIGLMYPRMDKSMLSRCLCFLGAMLLCYVFGTVWFMKLTGLPLGVTLGYCVWPFLPGDAVKIALAAFLMPRLAMAVKAAGR